MVWPKLVPPPVCTTPIDIVLEDGINEDGSPKAVGGYTGKCNYREEAKWSIDGERRAVRMMGIVLIDGDIAPGLEDITGTATIGKGKVRRIEKGARGRNPDGTVNYTRLELI